MLPVEIRPATPADRDAWVAMRFELWPDCPRARHELEVTQILASPGIVVLGWVQGQPAGFAELSIRSDHVEGTTASPVPYLEGWYVREFHRGKGVGRALIAFVEQWALQHGYTEFASDAELENTLSIELHGKLDFREVGRNVQFVKPLQSDRPSQHIIPSASAAPDQETRRQ